MRIVQSSTIIIHELSNTQLGPLQYEYFGADKVAELLALVVRTVPFENIDIFSKSTSFGGAWHIQTLGRGDKLLADYFGVAVATKW